MLLESDNGFIKIIANAISEEQVVKQISEIGNAPKNALKSIEEISQKKKATIIKTGYSAGIYGRSAEYFTVIVEDEETISFNGLYGSEHRVKKALEDKGYEVRQELAVYGNGRSREGFNQSLGERQAIRIIEKY